MYDKMDLRCSLQNGNKNDGLSEPGKDLVEGAFPLRLCVLLLFEGVELGGRVSVAKHLQSSLAGPLTTVLRRCGWRLAVLEVRGHGCWWRWGRHT